jgi:Myo-inositol oxygenase
MSLKNMARRLPRPIKDFVRRKLNERGFYDLGDIRGLGTRGFYNIRTASEITTVDEFKERAFGIMKRQQLQTREDVIALKKKYEQPIFGEIAVERLLELEAQIIDPTNIFMFTGSQLTHTLQVLERIEKAGITDREFLATTLIHDLGKLAILKGEKWENLEGGGKIPLGENVPGSGLENCTFTWDHADVVHARLHPYVSKDMAWLVKWHSIQPDSEPLMDARDRALSEKYFKPFARHDRTYIFHHLPKKRLSDYLPLVREFFPEKVVF